MGTRTFTYEDGWQTWDVPDGVDKVRITCDGGGAPGVGGGRVGGVRNIGGGITKLKILVGQGGGSASGQNGARNAQGGGGAGGDGNGHAGGDGGGGGSFVRANTTTGTLICAAGGAGGKSGDNGDGGRGGPATGENGGRGTSGSNSTSDATGGTPSQGGRGGGSSAGHVFDGHDGGDAAGARGGTGGDPGSNTGFGGGGGGGGFRPGGGGCASSSGYAPGGGGGGGSSYIGGISQGGFTTRGIAGSGNGNVVLEWSTGGGGGGGTTAEHRPLNPSNVKINGKPESPDFATRSTSRVDIKADTRDPQGKKVRIRVDYQPVPKNKNWKASATKPPKYSDFYVTPDKGNATLHVALTSLTINTRYEFRIWAYDAGGLRSSSYNGGSFWTNRVPDGPKLKTPKDNSQFDQLFPQTFTWDHQDPDGNTDTQTKFKIRFRTVASGGSAGPWEVKPEEKTSDESWVSDVREFKGNTFYEWTVRTADHTGRYGEWATPPYSFLATGTSAPPIPLGPINNQAVDSTDEVEFTWKFKDPIRADEQVKADIRYRAVDEDAEADAPHPEWHTVFGEVTDPGSENAWEFSAGIFACPGYRYEWQVRTYDDLLAEPSDWSASAFFHTICTPGGGLLPIATPDPNFIQGSLGCGSYRVCIYDRGGEKYRGEITPVASLMFSRLRDDISNCLVSTIGFGYDCGTLLKRTRSWMHEIVIFRDGVRVWEGPITRITYTRDSVEFEAKDCMAYLYRRIMRQGYSDGFAGTQSETAHGRSVVDRAYQIALNALSYQDPNLLPYITAYIYDNDARQARIVADYAQTAWQQIDDLAANAGLDYVTIGRRIILWDTHRPLGRLPEMRDGDFSEPPVVTEYGMQLATYSAVTNSTGKWGGVNKATNRDRTLPNGDLNPDFNDWYGPVELLASSYSETDSPNDMETQAKRNVAHRWPTPVVVRVPDNSTLNPETNVGFEQLVPGVWIPLRSDATLRTVEQWQKLDSVTVTTEGGVEKVSVVMSPAPNGGEDPDADEAAAEEAGG